MVPTLTSLFIRGGYCHPALILSQSGPFNNVREEVFKAPLRFTIPVRTPYMLRESPPVICIVCLCSI